MNSAKAYKSCFMPYLITNNTCEIIPKYWFLFTGPTGYEINGFCDNCISKLFNTADERNKNWKETFATNGWIHLDKVNSYEDAQKYLILT